MQITFRPDGTAEYIGDEQAPASSLAFGSRQQRRASHIEPVNVWLRLAFWLVRAGADDGDWLTDWTRTWTCLWQVRVVGGPTFGAFKNRGDAIAAEIKWLEENRL